MVAGKVKAAMGFQRSPATPKVTAGEAPRKSSCSPAAAPPSSNGKGGAAVFTRSFGVYFPRSPAQVQPRPPDIAELLRLVEELQEKESRLRTELLEYKILKETASIVPFLEREIASGKAELDLSRKSLDALEAENQALRVELEAMRCKIRSEEEEGRRKGRRIEEMEAEIEELKRSISQLEESRRLSNGATDECSSSQRFQGLTDASSKSYLLRRLKKFPKFTDIAAPDEIQRPESLDPKVEDGETDRTQQSLVKNRPPRVPRPPPTPSSSTSSSCSFSATSSTETTATASTTGIARDPCPTGLPPIPPPLPSGEGGAAPPVAARAPPPPPPPPPPARGARLPAACVRRVPEVVEFYHSLMRRDSKRESGGGVSDAPAAANARNMIGEIENRSAHLLAIKTDVETQGDFIRFLIKEVENASFTKIEDLVAFVKWLDEELSFLVDERAVLKHFEWPEQKADAMREAAFGYCDLKKLELEASSFRDDPRQPCTSALKKIQALLEKLEHGLYNLSRVREGAAKRYKGFHIPWEWMLETGLVSQIKLVSVKLAMKYMKRVTMELEAVSGSIEEEELMLQGVRFAFRVHQFAGGFDGETMRAFQELKDKARSFHLSQSHNQQHYQKFYSRSTSC